MIDPNYFEDCSWEPAGYDTNTCTLFSGKIGSSEFNNVIMAGYILYEVYDEERGFARENEIIHDLQYMGWINHVLGTSFSMCRRFDLWENVLFLMKDDIEQEADDVVDIEYLNERMMRTAFDIIPSGLEYAAFGQDLADIFYICNGTDFLDKQEASLKPDTYPYDLYRCKCLIRDYLKTASDEGMQRILFLLKQDRTVRNEIEDDGLKEIAEMSLILPARVLLYLTAELIESTSFWKLWKEYGEELYHDEIGKRYVPEEIESWRIAERERPIEPIRTSDFLREDSWFTFHNTPKELENKPKYFLSDDDRAYWWDGTDAVILSDDMDAWLQNLAKRHKEILLEGNFEEISKDFLKSFLKILYDTNNFYKRIFPFKNMFYEFVQKSYDQRYVAAVKLFSELANSEEYKKDGSVISGELYHWDLISRKITFNPARVKLKRYLGVMANEMLRKKYFGF